MCRSPIRQALVADEPAFLRTAPRLQAPATDEPAFLRIAPDTLRSSSCGAWGVECVQRLAGVVHHLVLPDAESYGQRVIERPELACIPVSADTAEPPAERRGKEPQLAAVKKEKHLPVDDGTTTVKLDMCKESSRADLLRLLDDSGLDGLYNFVYLPIKFKTGRNYGYAVVNFVDPAAMRRARVCLEGRQLSAEVAVTFSAFYCQGLEDLIEKYSQSAVLCEADDDVKPVMLRAGKLCVLSPRIPAPKESCQTVATTGDKRNQYLPPA